MTEETSNIDKVFRKKLSDYESKPNPDSWEKISDRLSSQEPKQEKNWLPYAMAAALLFLTTTSIFYFVNKEESQPLVKEETIAKTEKVITNEEITNPVQKEEKIAVKSPDKKITPSENTPPSISKILEVKADQHKKEILLPDGSTIVLNRDSKVKYADNFKEDRVLYLTGEAFFDVKPDPKHPFTIQCNLSKTTVLGTSFILRSYEKESYDEINVIEGKVSFSQKIEKGDEITILAGNKAVAEGTKIEQTVIKDINYNAWLTEKIIFNNTKLKEVFVVLEKYYNVSLSAKNPKILNCEFTGVFEKSDINEILQVLSVSFDLSFDHQSKNYTLSGKGCR
jgi:hypothetical protein